MIYNFVVIVVLFLHMSVHLCMVVLVVVLEYTLYSLDLPALDLARRKT